VLNEATLEPQVKGSRGATAGISRGATTPYYPLLYSLLYYPLLTTPYSTPYSTTVPVPQEMEALLTFAAKTNPFIAEPLG